MLWRLILGLALLISGCDGAADGAGGDAVTVDAGAGERGDGGADVGGLDAGVGGLDAGRLDASHAGAGSDAALDAARPIAPLPPRVGIAGLSPPGNVAAMAERGGLEWSLLRAHRTPAGEIDVDRLLDEVDCLVVPGGADIDPAVYGEPRHPTVDLISAARAEFDFAVLQAALDRRMPVLGLCLGGQMITVARGGSLVQDIPSEVPQPLDHRSVHDIEVVDGTLLASLYGPALSAAGTLEIFSNHHQAADGADLGAGLRVAARSADGVVEAFEAIDRVDYPFLVGTQYHPERQLDSGQHDGLIEGFRAACLAYQAVHPRAPSEPDHGDDWDYGACQSDQGPGVCLDVVDCAGRGGRASPGFCPGPAEVQCCAGVTCVSGSGHPGECFAAELCDQLGRVRVPWLCPGDRTVQCCLRE